MTNFDKLKENLKIEDLFGKNGEMVEWTNFMCKAINKFKQEKNCANRDCKECYKWLQQEYKEPILDEAEREYLSAVIKPFRNKVEWIMKYKPGYTIENEEYIGFSLPNQVIDLPFFKAGTMYKGMIAGKKYTLEELGL